MMLRGFEMGSLFGCSLEADPNVWVARLSNGLVKGHAYSTTGMRVVPGPNGEVRRDEKERERGYGIPSQVCLLRIRNPWGNEQEWNGPWSDNSREWKAVPDDVKKDMGLTFERDGEFW